MRIRLHIKSNAIIYLSILLFMLGIQNTYSLSGLPKDSLPKSSATVSLLTFGVGDDIYTKWGHNAIRIKTDEEDLVYNYGTFAFSPLFIIDFIHGKLIYWLSVADYKNTVAYYKRKKRDVFEQRLNLSSEQKEELILLLRENAKPQNREYAYNHLTNNCSTKIRDIIDKVTNNSIAKETKNKLSNTTIRQAFKEPINANPLLFFLFDFLISGSSDRKLSVYENMFNPANLKHSIKSVLLSKSSSLYKANGEKSEKLVLSNKSVYSAKRVQQTDYSSIAYIISYFLLLLILWGLVYPLFTFSEQKEHNFKISFVLIFLGVALSLLSILLIYINLFSTHEFAYKTRSHFAIFISEFLLIVAGFSYKRKLFRIKLLLVWSYFKLISISLFFILYTFSVFTQKSFLLFGVSTLLALIILALQRKLYRQYLSSAATRTSIVLKKPT